MLCKVLATNVPKILSKFVEQFFLLIQYYFSGFKEIWDPLKIKIEYGKQWFWHIRLHTFYVHLSNFTKIYQKWSGLQRCTRWQASRPCNQKFPSSNPVRSLEFVDQFFLYQSVSIAILVSKIPTIKNVTDVDVHRLKNNIGLVNWCLLYKNKLG